MKKTSSLFVGLAIAAVSLSSCSRSNYAFNSNARAYLGSEKAYVAASEPVSEPATASTLEAVPVYAEATTTHKIASALAQHSASAPVHTTKDASATSVASHAAVVLTKAERKALRQELKHQLTVAPKAAADGKSQNTALLLCIFLGIFGVHQFYLGYTGRGILRIALFLTSILIVPAIVNFILYVIDIIKIANGTLKPKDGEYAKKM